MSNSLPGLIVLAIGGSVAHPLLLLTILFLSSQRPLPNASALALGYFATCAVIGISGLLLFGGAESTVSTVGRIIATIGALLIVLGLRSSPSHSASCSERTSSSEASRGLRAWVIVGALQWRH
jgi:hypothetical protein